MAESGPSKVKGSSKMKSRSAKGHKETQHSHQNSPIQEHSFLTDRTDVKIMERELLGLMDDFHNGKLHAFGSDFAIDKMDTIRDLQEKAAQMHFQMDSAEMENDEEDETKCDRNLQKLMKNLENLSSTIQSLHKGDSMFHYPADDSNFDKAWPSSMILQNKALKCKNSEKVRTSKPIRWKIGYDNNWSRIIDEF